MKNLFCFYDMAVSPCSYDFFSFLYSAETCRIRRGLENIHLIIVHGPKNKFREDNIRSDEQNEIFFNNVIVPGISLLQSCSSFMWLARNQASCSGLSNETIFPRGYSLEVPVPDYSTPGHVASLIRQDKHSFLEAPPYAKSLARSLIENKCPDGKFITITVREIERDNKNNTRNLNHTVWQNAIAHLASIGIKTFVIRDTSSSSKPALFDGAEELPEASVHLPLRLAIYEKALVNFTKNNGPGGLLLYSKARTVYFNGFDDDVIALSRNWYSNNLGMNEGDQFPFTTLSKSCVWTDESEIRIIEEVEKALSAPKENAALNGFSNQANLLSSLAVGFRYLITQLSYELLDEDIELFWKMKELDDDYSMSIDFDNQLKTLPENLVAQDIVKELLEKTANAQGDLRFQQIR